ncbi:MAG: SpaA isopeptide-forming pilin-related protein [Mycoplasmatales bacterium]
MNKILKQVLNATLLVLMLIGLIPQNSFNANSVIETQVDTNEQNQVLKTSDETQTKTNEPKIEKANEIQIDKEKTNSQPKKENKNAISPKDLEKAIETPVTKEQKENAPTNAPSGTSIVGYTEGKAIFSSLSQEQLKAYIANPKKYPQRQTRAAGNSSGMITWQGQYFTPRIWIDGIGDVYCIEPHAQFPTGNNYDNGTFLNNNGVLAILVWGFPSNHGGQHGLSDDEAYIRTWVALNGFLGTLNRQTIEGYGDSYVNMLLGKGDSQDFQQHFLNVNGGGNSTYNTTRKQLETPNFTTSGASGDFWLTGLPSDAYMTNSSGQKVSTLSIGNSFKVATKNLAKTGRINFSIDTNVQKLAAIKYQSSGFQDLVNLRLRDPLAQISKATEFIPALGTIELDKKGLSPNNSNNTMIGLQGAEFTITNDEGETITVTTDANGKIRKDLLLGTYTIEETKPPIGYELNLATGVAYKEEFEVRPAQTIKLNDGNYVLNNIVKGGFFLQKVGQGFNNSDNTLKPLVGVEFKLTGLGMNKTLLTDAKGNLSVTGLKGGNYNLSETKPLKGYHGTFDQSFVIDTQGQIELLNNGRDLINDVNRGSFELTKVGQTFDNSDNTLKPLVGVKFRVKGLGYDKTFVTNQVGKISDNNLKTGTYEISELSTINGYVNAGFKTTFKIVNDGDHIKLGTNGQLENNVIKGSAHLIKHAETFDNNSNATYPLADVEFRVTGLGYDKTFITNDKGEINIPNLKYGTYTIVETKNPNGFIKPTYEETFKIDTNDQVVELNEGKELVNPVIKGNVHLTKVGEHLDNGNDTFNPLAGVEFTLMGTNGTTTPTSNVFTTDENGELTINGLKYGTYTLTETNAPAGYQTPTFEEEFEIKTNEQTVELNGGKPIKNYAILAHAMLQKIGNTFDFVEKIAEPTLPEIVKPTLLALPTSRVTMTNEELIQADSLEPAPLIRNPENAFIHNKEMHFQLDGAEFKIEGINGTVTPTEDVKVTDINGYIKFENLKPGTYRITETKAVVGYDINQPSTGKPYEVIFTVDDKPLAHNKIYELHGYDVVERPTSENNLDENGELTTPLTPVINKVITNDVEITKRDFSNHDEVEGAEIEVFNINDPKTPIHSWTSTKEAHKFKLKYGKYIVCEKYPPLGFLLNTECIKITVDTAGVTQKFDLMNKPITNSIIVQKTDFATGKELEGAKLKIINVETKETIDEWTSTKEAHTTEIRYGNYIICEDIAPIGYERKSECIKFSVTTHGITQKFKIDNKLIPIANTGNNFFVFGLIAIGVISYIGFRLVRRKLVK